MQVHVGSYSAGHKWPWHNQRLHVRGLSEISRGEGGSGNRGRVTTFWDCRKGRGREKWAVKRGRVMQICVRDHVEVHPQKKKDVLYFVKKPGRNKRVEWSAVRIRVGLRSWYFRPRSRGGLENFTPNTSRIPLSPAMDSFQERKHKNFQVESDPFFGHLWNQTLIGRTNPGRHFGLGASLILAH